MTDLLCTADNCRTIGLHQTNGCPNDNCTGCLPRLAADLVRLCTYHMNRIGTDARKLPALDDALLLVLDGIHAGGPNIGGGSSSGDKGINLNTRASDARSDIWELLALWSIMVADEKGITRPKTTIPAMAAFIDRHKEWLSAHQAAADASREFATLTRTAWGAAYPEGVGTTRHLGPCPVELDGQRCPGKLQGVMRRTQSLLPSWVLCDTDREHAWDSTQWMDLGEAMEAA